MSRVVALGTPLALLGWALVGVEVVEAANPDDVRLAWNALDEQVGLVILTPDARRALPPQLEGPLWAVLPE